jgi:5,10-methylenetetrahydrofolate reductase
MGFATAMQGDDSVLVAEVDPPKGTALEGFVDAVLAFRGRLDALAVTDGAGAIMRMTPLAPCRALIERGLDPLLILNGRDRNRISFQGDLLAAAALGIEGLLLEQGQDPAEGDQPMAASAGDLDLDGESLDGRTAFYTGARIDVSDDVNVNRRRADELPALADRGVRFAVLGPTYDMNIVDLFAGRAEDAGLDLLASVMFLKSVAMIRYLNNLPGVPSVPHGFLKQMMDAPLKRQAGLAIAADFLQDVRARCRGAVLLALGWGEQLPVFLDRVGR